MFRRSRPRWTADTLEFPGGTITTVPNPLTGMEFWLHAPEFTKSVFLGKTHDTPQGMGWFTDISSSDVSRGWTDDIRPYLRTLDKENIEGGIYLSWVADNHGGRYPARGIRRPYPGIPGQGNHDKNYRLKAFRGEEGKIPSSLFLKKMMKMHSLPRKKRTFPFVRVILVAVLFAALGLIAWNTWGHASNVPQPAVSAPVHSLGSFPEPRLIVPAAARVEPRRTYIVQPGDNLWDIALHHLGNGEDWRVLASVNHLRNPWVIYPEEVLVL